MIDPHNAADAAVLRLMGAFLSAGKATPANDLLADTLRLLAHPDNASNYRKENDQ
jgi:hypothetical protein